MSRDGDLALSHEGEGAPLPRLTPPLGIPFRLLPILLSTSREAAQVWGGPQQEVGAEVGALEQRTWALCAPGAAPPPSQYSAFGEVQKKSGSRLAWSWWPDGL